MRLSHGIHLAYCTNIHRGGDWPETFRSLNEHTLRVRDRVSSGKPYAIGLRLGDSASRQLAQADELDKFRAWLEQNECYVFTINGFPYGDFHGKRVKEQVYKPDWTTVERVEYTKRLFDILAVIAPAESGGSVSTVPCSFKEFINTGEQVEAMRRNVWDVVEHIDVLSEKTGRDLHLGLEPEPLCYLETTGEMIRFYRQLRDDRPGDDRLSRRLGINYDACHLAVEFEEAADALGSLIAEGVRISKLHFSSALRCAQTPRRSTAWPALPRIFTFTRLWPMAGTVRSRGTATYRMPWPPPHVARQAETPSGESTFTFRYIARRLRCSTRLPINCSASSRRS